MQFSYWEKNEFKGADNIAIIGAGIVGLSTAISLKEDQPETNVLVIDRSWPPKGASSKNAGFICFGSPSEILSDLKISPEEDVINLIKMRWQGAQLLQKRISKQAHISGGYELFKKDTTPNQEDYYRLNAIFNKATGVENHFVSCENNNFASFDSTMAYMPNEGMLDPMQVIIRLKQMAVSLGVKFLLGFEIDVIDHTNRCLISQAGTNLHYRSCVVCTNGFARKLLPNQDVTPVRNMVMVTNPLPLHNLKGVYHFDEGYIYFRNIGDRILIGGARNLAHEAEETDQFGINTKIRLHLEQFLAENVLTNMKFEIHSIWSGILGVSKDKFPIVKQITDDLYVGVKMGGMGVAIGSIIGQRLAKLVHE